MGKLNSLGKALWWSFIVALATAALYIGDLQRNILDDPIIDPMFIAPRAQPPPRVVGFPKPRWDESQLIERELEIDAQIARLETEYYKLRYHHQDPDVNYYRGEKNSAGERDGLGRVELPNGDIYMGQWKKNMVCRRVSNGCLRETLERHGIGGCVFAGGETYEAEWAFGDPHGFGSHRTPEGYHYLGEFVAGQPNGFGRALYGTKSYYMGSYREGVPHGYGNWTNGRERYEGQFVNGKRNGQGKLSSIADGKVLFEGSFQDDVPVKAGWTRRASNTQSQQDLNNYATTADYEEIEDEMMEEEERETIPLRMGSNFGF